MVFSPETGLTADQKASIPASASAANPLVTAADLPTLPPSLEALSYPVMVGGRDGVFVGYATLEEAAAAAATYLLPIVINASALFLEADVQLVGNVYGRGPVGVHLTTGTTLTLSGTIELQNVNVFRDTNSTAKIVLAAQGTSPVLSARSGVQLVNSRLGPNVFFSSPGHSVTVRGRSSIDVARGNPGTIYLCDSGTARAAADGPTLIDLRPDTTRSAAAAAFIRAGGLLSRPLVLPGFGGYNNGFSDGSALAQSFWFEPAAPMAADALQLVFGNWILGNSYVGGTITPGMLPGLNPITVKAALYNGEDLFPFTFNEGQPSARILPGMTLPTDRLPRWMKKGPGATVLQWSVAVDTLGQKWPLGLTSRNSAPGDVIGQQMNSGPVIAYHPIAVLGDLAAPPLYDSVGLVCDSIGVGGGAGDRPDLGYPARGLNAANICWTRMATWGATLDTYTDLTKVSVALPNLVGVGHIVTNIGANNMLDLLKDGLAVMQARYRAYWSALAAGGAKVHQCTITPYDNTNADFVDLKAALNDWFRTVPAPLTSCIDAAALAETAINSNLWKPGYSTDGLHPNETGAAAIAAAINPSTFLL